MSSVAQKEFVTARNRMATKARKDAKRAYRQHFGQDEGDKRLEALINALQRNMIAD